MSSSTPSAPPTTQSAPAPASAPPPLLITVRFSTSLPDLDLPVPSPHQTTVLLFKHDLRHRITSPSRLRLIYQGRILADTAPLSSVFKLRPATAPAPPPPPPSDPKGKGKAVVRDSRPSPPPPPPQPPVRVYLNCSVGDELSAAELDAEEAAAASHRTALPSTTTEAAAAHDEEWGSVTRSKVQQRRPRGFDRLLQAGLSADEVATLRTQFAAIRTRRLAHDAAPSPDTLRGMEDAWIDGNAGEISTGSHGGDGGGGGIDAAAAALDDDLTGLAGLLDVIIRAMVIGFFFPLGSFAWLIRQDVWGEQWRMFVGSGIVLSLTVGVFVTMSGQD